jgi:hypothetical protein
MTHDRLRSVESPPRRGEAPFVDGREKSPELIERDAIHHLSTRTMDRIWSYRLARWPMRG